MQQHQILPVLQIPSVWPNSQLWCCEQSSHPRLRTTEPFVSKGLQALRVCCSTGRYSLCVGTGSPLAFWLWLVRLRLFFRFIFHFGDCVLLSFRCKGISRLT